VRFHHGEKDRFVLTVSDNGVGLPVEMKLEDCESLGLKLVSVLAKQLKGGVQIAAGAGTEIRIAFKISEK